LFHHLVASVFDFSSFGCRWRRRRCRGEPDIKPIERGDAHLSDLLLLIDLEVEPWVFESLVGFIFWFVEHLVLGELGLFTEIQSEIWCDVTEVTVKKALPCDPAAS
jgi:hypothetical protein